MIFMKRSLPAVFSFCSWFKSYYFLLLPRGKYGDWSSCEPGFVRGDPYYSDSLFFYYILKITVQLAFIAKNAGESERLEAIRINMSNILMDSYYDKEHRIFGDGGL